MLSDDDLQALRVTIKLALFSTFILLCLSAPLAWWLARTKWRFKYIIEACIALPLVLPPTVLGFYLLIWMSPSGLLGQFSQAMGWGSLAFSFSGLVIGSCLYSLPFVVQPLQNAFRTIDPQLLDAAATLGANRWDRITSIILPLAKPGVISAAALGFAHTLGEFGVVLMIGGNIPGETQVVSIAIYDHVESLQYAQAHWLSATLLVISFVLLAAVFAVNRRSPWGRI